MKRQKWTDEKVLSEIVKRKADNKSLTYAACKAEDGPLMNAATRRFVSWPAAVEASGCEQDRLHSFKPKDYILQEIRSRAEKQQSLVGRDEPLCQKYGKMFNKLKDEIACLCS